MDTTHGFENLHTDTPELCTCGAAFVTGYNLHTVKVAHLEAHGLYVEPMTPIYVPTAALGFIASALDVGLEGAETDEGTAAQAEAVLAALRAPR